MVTLEQLLSMEIQSISPVTGEDINFPPEFRVAVQEKTPNGVRVIIHAMNHDSDTLDLLIKDNSVTVLKSI